MKLWRYLLFCNFFFFSFPELKDTSQPLLGTILLQIQEFLKGLDGEFLKVTVIDDLTLFVQQKIYPWEISTSIRASSTQVMEC